MTWIYILVILGLAAFWYTNGGSDNSSMQTQTTYSDFKEMVKKGYAKEIVVNKNDGSLLMYVKPEHIYDVFHQHVKTTGKNPAVMVGIGSADQVEQFINKMRDEGHFTGKYAYDNSKDSEFFNSLIWNILFFGVFIFIWMFIMRRMSGGGGSGMMGGGIFNVGKSKAQMYEKGGELGITFKDVAGQAGAKQEMQEIVDFLKSPQK